MLLLAFLCTPLITMHSPPITAVNHVLYVLDPSSRASLKFQSVARKLQFRATHSSSLYQLWLMRYVSHEVKSR